MNSLSTKELFEFAQRAFADEMDVVVIKEADILAKTVMVLEAIGALVNREADAPRRGVADIIACVDGKYVAIELKDNEGIPSKQQLRYINKVRAAGGIAGVCRTLRDVFELLAKAVEK